MKNTMLRLIRVLFGLFLFALGSYLTIQANIGLGPWEAFGVGVSSATSLSYGDVIVFSGMLILVIDMLLKEKVGVATILNTLLIGKMMDGLKAVQLVPMQSSFFPGLLMMLLGQVVISLSMYFYIGAGLGAGPRDSLMVALGKRLERTPIGLVRGIVEGSALLCGVLLGAKIGIGTIIYVVGISFIMQATFSILKFNVKGIAHESLFLTVHRLFPSVKLRRP